MISIIIPTKNRVNNLKKVLKTLNDNTLLPKQVEVIFYVDHDDSNTINFIKSGEINKHLGKIPGSAIVNSDKLKLADTYNYSFKKCKGDIIMYSADDVHFKTKNWDALVREEFNRYPDKICLVFGPDGMQPNGTLATHGFLSRRAIEHIGYVHPIGMGYNYSDNWLTDMYRKLDRLVYTPVYFEHCHWGCGKAELDETYRSGSDAPHDDSIDLWVNSSDQREGDIQKLREILQSGPRGNSNKENLKAIYGINTDGN
jgi:glycosyltransferase involved in cell wall biosynthesis